MKEKDQKQLRKLMREELGRQQGKQSTASDQAEGERDLQPSEKVKSTPGQAEGDRQDIEEELEEHRGKTKH